MGKTLAEKIWAEHVVRQADGEPDLIYIDLHLIHEVTSPQAFEEGTLTAMYVKMLEEKIKLHPSNYLWSHKRFKYDYDAALHEKLLVK